MPPSSLLAQRANLMARTPGDAAWLRRLAGNDEEWLSSAHRIFNVARPTRARIIEMIQKRITMVGSDQPFFSK